MTIRKCVHCGAPEDKADESCYWGDSWERCPHRFVPTLPSAPEAPREGTPEYRKCLSCLNLLTLNPDSVCSDCRARQHPCSGCAATVAGNEAMWHGQWWLCIRCKARSATTGWMPYPAAVSQAKAQEHRCGLQGFGAGGDACPPCEQPNYQQTENGLWCEKHDMWAPCKSCEPTPSSSAEHREPPTPWRVDDGEDYCRVLDAEGNVVLPNDITSRALYRRIVEAVNREAVSRQMWESASKLHASLATLEAENQRLKDENTALAWESSKAGDRHMRDLARVNTQKSALEARLKEAERLLNRAKNECLSSITESDIRAFLAASAPEGTQ